ncbi:MAG TPA: hypothetical protein VFV92_03390, partial [Candidatus Bathyarchaeia archaeon]|nr:hypothetical protein [Candidatus Bathyarchaeia archaeon]
MRIAQSITVVLLGCLYGVAVEAQQTRIAVPAITFLDEQPRAYRVGEALKLNGNYQDLKRVGGASNLQVRIFKASREDLLYRFKNLTSDGCVIYPSRLYKAREYDGGVKILSKSDRPSPIILTESWLATNGKQQVFDQDYLLVFERSGETGEILKLREQDVKPYFAIGFAFVVKAPTRPLKGMQVEVLARAESAAQAEAFERIQQIAGRTGGVGKNPEEPKVPCKTFFRLEF